MAALHFDLLHHFVYIYKHEKVNFYSIQKQRQAVISGRSRPFDRTSSRLDRHLRQVDGGKESPLQQKRTRTSSQTFPTSKNLEYGGIVQVLPTGVDGLLQNFLDALQNLGRDSHMLRGFDD